MKDSGSEDGLLYGGQTEQGRSEFVLKTNGRFSWQGERSKRMFLVEECLLLCLLLLNLEQNETLIPITRDLQLKLSTRVCYLSSCTLSCLCSLGTFCWLSGHQQVGREGEMLLILRLYSQERPGEWRTGGSVLFMRCFLYNSDYHFN